MDARQSWWAWHDTDTINADGRVEDSVLQGIGLIFHPLQEVFLRKTSVSAAFHANLADTTPDLRQPLFHKVSRWGHQINSFVESLQGGTLNLTSKPPLITCI
jgi:hypothetical protein